MFDFEQILIETGQIFLLFKSMMMMLTIHFGMVKMATEFRLRIWPQEHKNYMSAVRLMIIGTTAGTLKIWELEIGSISK